MNTSEKPAQLITSDPVLLSWTWLPASSAIKAEDTAPPQTKPSLGGFDVLYPLRQLLSSIDIRQGNRASQICQLIPAQCPFERTIHLFGRPLVHIPPLCKLNPLYEDLVELRFRALCYLADECGEDISRYC